MAEQLVAWPRITTFQVRIPLNQSSRCNWDALKTVNKIPSIHHSGPRDCTRIVDTVIPLYTDTRYNNSVIMINWLAYSLRSRGISLIRNNIYKNKTRPFLHIILYNIKFISVTTSLGTNAVVVTRVHCTCCYLHYHLACGLKLSKYFSYFNRSLRRQSSWNGEASLLWKIRKLSSIYCLLFSLEWQR